MKSALTELLPGLILDLRETDEYDDDKDAMQSRIDTVTSALAIKDTGEGKA